MSEHMNGYTCEDVEDALLDAQREAGRVHAQAESLAIQSEHINRLRSALEWIIDNVCADADVLANVRIHARAALTAQQGSTDGGEG